MAEWKCAAAGSPDAMLLKPSRRRRKRGEREAGEVVWACSEASDLDH